MASQEQKGRRAKGKDAWPAFGIIAAEGERALGGPLPQKDALLKVTVSIIARAKGGDNRWKHAGQ